MDVTELADQTITWQPEEREFLTVNTKGGYKPGSNKAAKWKRTIAARDGAECWYCRTPFQDDLSDATLDHFIPRSLLPGWHNSNLVLACRPCQQGKANKLPSQWLRDLVRFAPGLVPVDAR
jgi:5-methylcytosine-specific restriction endonuclease McrA